MVNVVKTNKVGIVSFRHIISLLLLLLAVNIAGSKKVQIETDF